MEKAIVLLSENLDLLKNDLDQEVKQFSQILNQEKELSSKQFSSSTSQALSEQSEQLLKQLKNLKEQINYFKQKHFNNTKLEVQLVQKEQELTELQIKNVELTKQCLCYLELIKSFREKQKELENTKQEMEEKPFAKKALDKLCQLQAEFTTLDNQLETIIQEQSIILKKKHP